jgi:hypothetical protein
MEMDDTLIHLKAGEVVQRGAIHNWINNGMASVRRSKRSGERCLAVTRDCQ